MKCIRIHKAAALALGLAALTLVGCAGAGGDVSVLQSSQVAIAPGSTYAWKAMSGRQSGDSRVDNDIIRQRITEAVDSSLAAKGFREISDPSAAQLIVSYHVGLQNRTDYEVDAMGGLGWGWGFYGAPTDIRSVDYEEGTLMVDIEDRASGQLAWRATSQKRVDQADATQGGLDAIVADMMKSLPGAAPPRA